MLRHFLLILIRFYRSVSSSFHFLSQVFGVPCQCKFPLSCSEYAKHQLENSDSLFVALGRIFYRLLRCSPFGILFLGKREVVEIGH